MDITRIIVFLVVMAAMIAIPVVAIFKLARNDRKSLLWAIVMVAFVACAAWFVRGFKESLWRLDQSLHIRWNVTNFSDQYNRLRKLGDEVLLHTYVTNFSCNACTLLNYKKYAPNTTNLVARYYFDWDERIRRKESEYKREDESDEARQTCDGMCEKFKLRYGFLADVLFVSQDVKAGTVLTKDKLQRRDYVGMGVIDRCLRVEDLESVLGRKVAFDLKRGSILFKTDLCKENVRWCAKQSLAELVE